MCKLDYYNELSVVKLLRNHNTQQKFMNPYILCSLDL